MTAGSRNPGYPNVVAGRSAADDTPTDIFMDVTSGTLYTGGWVWNSSTLEWDKMTQPTGYTQGDLDSYWKDKRYDYTSGNLDYKGFSVTHKLAEATATWEIWKYTWVGTNCTRIEGPLTGSWTGRAALAWA